MGETLSLPLLLLRLSLLLALFSPCRDEHGPLVPSPDPELLVEVRPIFYFIFSKADAREKKENVSCKMVVKRFRFLRSLSPFLSKP